MAIVTEDIKNVAKIFDTDLIIAYTASPYDIHQYITVEGST